MQDYKEIRQRFLSGESQRHIAKTMGISRNTVAKYCEGESVPWERKTPERESTIITDDVTEFIPCEYKIYENEQTYHVFHVDMRNEFADIANEDQTRFFKKYLI